MITLHYIDKPFMELTDSLEVISNIPLRNGIKIEPKKIKKILFKGVLMVKEQIVINVENDNYIGQWKFEVKKNGKWDYAGYSGEPKNKITEYVDTSKEG